MGHEELLKLRSELTSEKNTLDSRLLEAERALASHHESICGICDQVKYSAEDPPEGWGWLDSRKNFVLLCDKCIKRWEDRWVICNTTREIVL